MLKLQAISLMMCKQELDVLLTHSMLMSTRIYTLFPPQMHMHLSTNCWILTRTSRSGKSYQVSCSTRTNFLRNTLINGLMPLVQSSVKQLDTITIKWSSFSRTSKPKTLLLLLCFKLVLMMNTGQRQCVNSCIIIRMLLVNNGSHRMTQIMT